MSRFPFFKTLRAGTLLFMGVFLLLACSQSTKSQTQQALEAEKEQEDIPDLFLKKPIHRFLNHKGELEWVLKSKTEESFEKKDVVFLYDFVYIEYQDNRKIRYCSGKKAKITGIRTDKERFVLEIFGDAHVKDEETNNALESDYLIWNNKTGKLRSHKIVKVTKKNGTTIGRGMVADKNLENMVLDEHIETIYHQ